MQEVIEAARENQLNPNTESLRDLNQAQRNFQFRSRAKTSKEGNNGLDKKDWILKKIFRQFLHWMKTRDVFNIVVSYTERFKDQINYTLLAGESNQSDSKTKYLFTFMKVRQNYRNLHLAKLFSCSVSTIANIVTPIIHVIHSIY